mmetsp:Transcript_31841/g.31555  ORF Transcript_31841/g.31555 Transcript_31841/m.31555 type:complete len:86 (-) Transcript_31841:667-924(-)
MATSLVADGENAIALIPFSKGCLKLAIGIIEAVSHIKMLGLLPTSPVAARSQFGESAKAIISSTCLLKKVCVHVSLLSDIPSPAA